MSEKKIDKDLRKLQLGFNMTTALRSSHVIIPDLMEFETKKNHVGKTFCPTK